MSAKQTVKNVAVTETAITNVANSLGLDWSRISDSEIEVTIASGSWGTVSFRKDAESGDWNYVYDDMHTTAAKRFINLVKMEDTVLDVSEITNGHVETAALYSEYFESGIAQEAVIVYN